MNIAVVVFAKTPGLSAIKTRLAKSIGPLALEFYKRSIHTTQIVLQSALEQFKAKQNVNCVQIFWAIAEKEGLDHNLWKNVDVLWQGEGNLGDRLHFIYQKLLQKVDYVLLMGSDSPHLKCELIESVLIDTAQSKGKNILLGPCIDGGFYLFGSGENLASQIWKKVRYSSSQAFLDLSSNLNSAGLKVNVLPRGFDVDTIDDLQRYFLFDKSEFHPSQVDLINFLCDLKC